MGVVVLHQILGLMLGKGIGNTISQETMGQLTALRICSMP